MTALAARNVAKARELVGRAVQLDATRAEYHAQHARCLALLYRNDEARAAAEDALAAGATDPRTLDTIGVVLSRLGEHARAAELFERAAAAEPHNAGFQYNLAASLRFLGRFGAAERAYEAVLEAAPDFHRAHSALAELRRQTPRKNHVARLTRALEHANGKADAELHVRYALAKEHEDLGNYAQAFEHLRVGKARKRAALGYCVDDDRNLFETIIRTFHAGFLGSGHPACDSAEPIFVVGMPRTGTTLVERILSTHPSVASAGESQNLPLLVKRAAGTRSNRVLDEATVAAAASLDFAELGRRYVESTRPAGGLPRFVDKMPLNFLYVGFIHLALPRAKIVCLRRHPLDTCLSNFRQLFALDFSYYNYAYDLADIGRYYVLFDTLMRHWGEALPGRVLEMSYERLVEEQETQTKRLLDFCGLPWAAECLDFHENRSPVATASAVQVRTPMNRGSIGRWRHYARELAPLRAQLVADGIDIEG